MNNKEKVIQLLINEYNNSTSNPIKIDKNDIKILQISENEIIKILLTLQEDGLIIAKSISPHKDFSLYWEITVKTNCLNYFQNQKHAEILDKRNRIKTYTPIIISSLSLLVSIAALVVSIIKLSKGM